MFTSQAGVTICLPCLWSQGLKHGHVANSLDPDQECIIAVKSGTSAALLRRLTQKTHRLYLFTISSRTSSEPGAHSMAPTTLFEPIGHESVADAAVAQIEDLIASGILRQGRKLPSERELAEMLGISRPKLREALKLLEDSGLVVSKHGEGTFVAALTGQAMLPALLALYGRHEPAFFDYLEYRREQECFAAGLAAERATKADKARIESILTELERQDR